VFQVQINLVVLDRGTVPWTTPNLPTYIFPAEPTQAGYSTDILLFPGAGLLHRGCGVRKATVILGGSRTSSTLKHRPSTWLLRIHLSTASRDTHPSPPTHSDSSHNNNLNHNRHSPK
jgi:hypothetical protein